ncbi:MAG: ribbon-helix-helix protein, CopG family [Chloroflexi bacterium]|nr:ribbon-helix-helix protein, CopG family [Chloroflexota bacterium]
MMRRTQIQLDEATYQLLRQKAHERHVSLARVVREAVAQYLTGAPKRRLTLADFKWIGMGSVDPEPGRAVSEDHDAEWGDVIYEEIREKAEELRRLEESRGTE